MAKSGKKPALGRGLSALLQDPENDIQSATDKNADQVVGNVIELAIEQIEVNPFQPRTQFNEESLKELAGSIKELGIIQPITVRKTAFNAFQLVSQHAKINCLENTCNHHLRSYAIGFLLALPVIQILMPHHFL